MYVCVFSMMHEGIWFPHPTHFGPCFEYARISQRLTMSFGGVCMLVNDASAAHGFRGSLAALDIVAYDMRSSSTGQRESDDTARLCGIPRISLLAKLLLVALSCRKNFCRLID